MPRTRKLTPPTEKVCICGCGRSFLGRASRIYFNDSCKQRVRNRRIKLQQQRDEAFDLFMKGLRHAYSRLTLDKFCEVIGEPVSINETENRYAYQHWTHFQVAAKELGHLGTHLDKLVKWGMEQE